MLKIIAQMQIDKFNFCLKIKTRRLSNNNNYTDYLKQRIKVLTVTDQYHLEF